MTARKTSASPTTKDSKPKDAIALLKADHRVVEGLFEEYESSKSASAKSKLAAKICMELAIHTRIEEEIFYPAVKGAVEEDMLDEAYVEHDGAKMLIAEILAGEPSDDYYDAKVKVLSEEIKHHVKEEEQADGLFAQAKKSDLDMKQLGEQLAARKAELVAEYKDGVPQLETRSMTGVKLAIGHAVA